MLDFRKTIHDQHDFTCNQKYGDGLPYSFHLKAAEKQAEKFIHLVFNNRVIDPKTTAKAEKTRTLVMMAVVAHDVIEDGRMTYNDVVNTARKFLSNRVAAIAVAEMVYDVTDFKGRDRKERKNEDYYKALKSNELSLFVKLCDMAANRIYGKLFNSSQYYRYVSEFPEFKKKLYIERYDELFSYVEKI